MKNGNVWDEGTYVGVQRSVRQFCGAFVASGVCVCVCACMRISLEFVVPALKCCVFIF